MTWNTEVFLKVADHLAKIGATKARMFPITLDTELYLDLGIYGDVLFFDLVLWAYEEFGVEPNLVLRDYAPGEFVFFGIWTTIRKMIGRERKYKSLKMRDAVAAIEVKRWSN